MRKKRMFYILMAIFLVLPPFLLTPGVGVAEGVAQTGEYSYKDEVVYATLNPSGEREEVYVVNIFDVVTEGNIIDHGTYSNVKNLTNLAEIEQEKNRITFPASEGKFYYQGDKNNAELPWDISIFYFLNGEKIDPDQLAGKDGDIEIRIQTTANENVNSVFFENYLLQISLNLAPDVFDNIETAGGVVANAGKNKQVTFTVMPEQAGDLSVKADAVDFELQGMDIAAVPQSMSIEAPDMDDMTSEMQTLTDAIKEISNGVGELNNGVSELNTGVVTLRDGSAQYQDGILDINGASSGLVDASVSIDQCLTQMSNSLQENTGEMDLSALKELPEGLMQLAEGLRQTQAGLTELKENYALAYSSLDEAIMAIPDHEITEDEIKALYASGADKEIINQLVDTYKAARTAKGTYAKTKEAFSAVEPTLNQVSGSITEMANSVETMATEITASLENMNVADTIGELQKGLETLSSNYKEFHAGLVGYTDGVAQLSSSYKDVHGGIVDLADGTVELAAGVGELDEGTDTLYQSTKDMPEQIEKEVDQMIAEYDKSDFDRVSFVSAENDKINTVQFVIKTESIEKEEQETTEEQVEEEKGFWDRLIALFKGV
ncbi:hypothetical protein GCM10011351_12180 [Paraliobacillus quinghaiensis]|uniref:YhgE/Pip domain-containing protein n=1 Tax=Paraliobacillus quinghaiensis TaxID=470815 RepID=A0A917TLP5_9BACI|nr:YhgE/Pip domain-containing protein [Paraliobacillus quinghaiensis]GGM27843.1 hypothetical protein GCM10011351_12180 [Paraliobacillus quinghaiensis]